MRFLDKVTVFSGGGRNPDGTLKPEVQVGPFPATMTPVKSDSSLPYRTEVIGSYCRLLIHKSAAEVLKSNGAIMWRGRRWAVQGDVENQVIPGGRTHHLAATVKYGA